MSLEATPTLSGLGEEHSPHQIMHKPSPVDTQSRDLAPPVKRKTSTPGWSTLSYLFVGAATLITVSGLIYVGYQLTKPIKKSRVKEAIKGEGNPDMSKLSTEEIQPNKVTKEEDQEESKVKQGEKVNEPIKSLTLGMGDRHEVVIERKQNQAIGIMLCPGENKELGASVPGNAQKKKKDHQEPGRIYIDVKEAIEIDTTMSYVDMAKIPVKQQQNQSPSPVLVEKPAANEVAELESLGAKDQQPVQSEGDAPNTKVIDETTGAVAEPAIIGKEDKMKSALDGSNVSS